MSSDVVVIGLDAAEATLLEKWADEGYLPMFAHLRRQGAVSRLENCLETLPGAIWPELETGRSGAKLGLFYHPCQLHTGEARARAVEPAEVNSNQYYWSIASGAGRRVAVIDQVQTVPLVV